MLHIVLVEPEIPQNCGNVARTCAAPGSGFYADPDDGRCEVRIAYVHNCEYLRRAIELLGRGIAAYNRKRGV